MSRLRPRSALFVLAAAVLLGGSTGVFLLPDPDAVFAGPRGAGPTGVPSPGAAASASPSPTSTPRSSPTPTPPTSDPASASPTGGTPSGGSGPVSEDDLVSLDAFAAAGIDVDVYPMNGATDPGAAITTCTDERKVGARTLADLTGRDPALAGNWNTPDGSGSAYEVLAVAESPELAAVYAKRLVAAQTVCQDEPVGHDVYGPVRTEKVPAGSSARWLGRWEGATNTTGRAPEGSEPCGGVVVASNGTHLAVLEVYLCADSAAMAVLARDAAAQLG